MNNDLIIRDGKLCDAVEIRAIASPLMKSFGLEPDFADLDYELGHFGENYKGLIAQLVACFNGAVIGSIVLKVYKDNVAKITGFYISPDFQGKGVGKNLLSVAIQRAKLSGQDGIYLETWDKMESATSLYKKLGWKKTTDPHIDSGAERSYYLELN